MRIRKADISSLLKPHKSLFRYAKEGIILTHHYVSVNLTTLFYEDAEHTLDILERLLEEDLDKSHRKDVNEIYQEFKELYKNK